MTWHYIRETQGGALINQEEKQKCLKSGWHFNSHSETHAANSGEILRFIIYWKGCSVPDSSSRKPKDFVTLSRRSLALSNTRWGSASPVASTDSLNDLGAGATVLNKDLYIIHHCTWNSPLNRCINLPLCSTCFPWSNGELTSTGKRETVFIKNSLELRCSLWSFWVLNL